MTILDVVGVLGDLGILPVISIGATLFLAGIAYRRFRGGGGPSNEVRWGGGSLRYEEGSGLYYWRGEDGEEFCMGDRYDMQEALEDERN